MYKKNYFLLMLFGLYIFVDASNEDVIAAIIKQNLTVYSYKEPDWVANDARLKEFLDFVIDSQKNLQEYERRSVAFGMLSRFIAKYPLTKNSVKSDAVSYKDLTLFCDQENSLHYLAKIVDRSQTIFGRVNLHGMLGLQTDDIAELSNKQEIVKIFLDDHELMKSLKKVLIKCRAVENSVLTFWINDPLRQVASRKFFNYSSKGLSDYCNSSPLLLNMRSAFEHEQRTLEACVIIIAAGLLPIYGISKIADKKIFSEKLEGLSEKLYSTGGSTFGLLHHYSDHPYSTGGLAIVSGLISAMYVTESVEWSYDNFILDQFVYEKMRSVAMVLTCLRNVYDVIGGNERLKGLLHDEYNHLKKLVLHKQDDSKMQSFLHLFSSNNFAKKSSFFNNTGRALVAFRMCSMIKEELEAPLMALGKIDAFLSIAQLYKEYEHGDTPYCFTTYNDRSMPMIELQDFWNPCIKAKKIIKNSVSLGKDQPTNMIITGPNAGGKSTLLKGLASAIVLAQGFGIAPASRADITPFSMIMTYLNIVDDLAGGSSLFKNQVLRMQKIFNAVRFLSKDQKALVVLDEMFNGASPKEAEACAYGVAYLLGQQSHVVNVIATHHQILTALPDSLSSYKNYHVSVNKEANGTITYPFKLEEGISDQHVALDILLNEGFDIPFIRKAEMMMVGT